MNAQAVALKKSNFETEFEGYESQIAMSLPAHISVDKFKRVVLSAVSRNPDLYIKADKRSLFLACQDCAADGLLPDGREAALVIYNTKVNGEWIKKVQYIPMIRGIIKRMRNSGEVAAVDSQVVYQNDRFQYQLGDDPKIIHEPTLGEPGAMIGAYAIITLTNGEKLREVMNKAQIEKIRLRSKNADKGPWVDDAGEMWRKTVTRRCSKRAPSSPDLERLWQRGDDVDDDAPALPAPPRPTRQAYLAPVEPEPEREVDPAAAGHENLDERFKATVAHDEATGEIDETSAPLDATRDADNGRPAEATQATPQAEGADVAADEYDAAKEYDLLWQGALAEQTQPGLEEYWKLQRQRGAAAWRLYNEARDLYDELAGKIKTQIAVLGGLTA